MGQVVLLVRLDSKMYFYNEKNVQEYIHYDLVVYILLFTI